MSAESHVTVHRFEASLFPVNASLVETRTGVVVVDATLGVTDGRKLRARVDALNKPLAALIITHSHPDHYGGVTSLLNRTNVPIYAVAGVEEVGVEPMRDRLALRCGEKGTVNVATP